MGVGAGEGGFVEGRLFGLRSCIVCVWGFLCFRSFKVASQYISGAAVGFSRAYSRHGPLSPLVFMGVQLWRRERERETAEV